MASSCMPLASLPKGNFVMVSSMACEGLCPGAVDPQLRRLYSPKQGMAAHVGFGLFIFLRTVSPQLLGPASCRIPPDSERRIQGPEYCE